MASLLYAAASPPIAILNREGKGGVVVLCEHASNYIPAGYDRLGLAPADLERHIAWDIGALAVAEQMAAMLDAPLAYATHSRLLLDLNRDPDAPDSILTLSEDTAIPGNLDLAAYERRLRSDWLYAPFHAGVDALIDHRLASGQATVVVSIHSFTPVYLGAPRPWPVGVLGSRDRRLADPVLPVDDCAKASVAADARTGAGKNSGHVPVCLYRHAGAFCIRPGHLLDMVERAEYFPAVLHPENRGRRGDLDHSRSRCTTQNQNQGVMG